MKRTHRPVDRRSAAQMHALAAVRREIGPRDRAGRSKYLREFNAAFRQYDAPLTHEQLNTRLASADIILVGDYHALPACQKFASHIVEQIAGKRPVVLGVEAVLSRDQPILDCWWRREISEVELHERLRFDCEWGYEWAPFYDLLISVRENADGVYGLDCLPRYDLRRIRSRDRHAAEKIRDVRERHPQAVLVVLFGESHMASQHLPALVKKELPSERTITVLQNLDALYWQAMDEGAEVVSLGPDTVCVFNANPLEKYENYRLCLERWHGDDTPDFTPAVHNLILSLARSLGFRADSPRNGTQPKHLVDSLPEVVYLGEHESADSLNLIQRADLEHGGCIYAPQSNTVYIREFNINAASREAARFLRHACTRANTPHVEIELERTLAHFGSRLLSLGGLDQNQTGEKLYQAYVEGRVTRAQVRRMFLGKAEL